MEKLVAEEDVEVHWKSMLFRKAKSFERAGLRKSRVREKGVICY
jgi:hypothetical protein